MTGAEMDMVAVQAHGCVGADLAAMCSQAAMLALRRAVLSRQLPPHVCSSSAQSAHLGVSHCSARSGASKGLMTLLACACTLDPACCNSAIQFMHSTGCGLQRQICLDVHVDHAPWGGCHQALK